MNYFDNVPAEDKKIVQLLADGKTAVDISRILNVTRYHVINTVQRIKIQTFSENATNLVANFFRNKIIK